MNAANAEALSTTISEDSVPEPGLPTLFLAGSFPLAAPAMASALLLKF